MRKRDSTRLKSSRVGLAAYLAALLCFAFGLMSKPMVVTLPFVLLLLDFWPLRRFELGNFRSQLPQNSLAYFGEDPFLPPLRA